MSGMRQIIAAMVRSAIEAIYCQAPQQA